MNEEPSRLTPAEEHAWRNFVRLQSKLIGRLSRDLQTESNLSAADYTVLVNLTEVPEGRLRFLDLTRAVEWEKSRMSHHIARMTKRGLVAREACPEDGRGAYVVATPAGREAIAAAAPRHAGAVRRLFIAPFTPQELNTFSELSKCLLEQLEKDDDDREFTAAGDETPAERTPRRARSASTAAWLERGRRQCGSGQRRAVVAVDRPETVT